MHEVIGNGNTWKVVVSLGRYLVLSSVRRDEACWLVECIACLIRIYIYICG